MDHLEKALEESLRLQEESRRMARREFLSRTAKGGAALLAVKALSKLEAGQPFTPFQHGVASGDPQQDRVIIWTRITPSPEATPGSTLGAPTRVEWKVAADAGFRTVVRAGTATSAPASDHTIKIDVVGLLPGQTYYYRFSALGFSSPIGRTRTLPAVSTNLHGLRFAFVSCSNFEGGYFAPYRYIGQRNDLQFVVHLGDYIYEYAPGAYGPGLTIGRVHQPANEIVTLADYRIRHANYKRDPDLQLAHQQHPFITIWDDHEVTNNAWKAGAENHQPEEGNYFARRLRAFQAYFEWMPIRPFGAADSNQYRIYRTFKVGNLFDLIMMDLRTFRDEQLASPIDPRLSDPNRSITGAKQKAWIKEQLSASTAFWRVLGNSVMISPLLMPAVPQAVSNSVNQMRDLFAPQNLVPINTDQWDGYQADQMELLRYLKSNRIGNTVFLTGDIHSSWANELPADFRTYPQTRDSVAVEYVSTSITSDGIDESLGVPQGFACGRRFAGPAPEL